jgi:hypothetical protein
MGDLEQSQNRTRTLARALGPFLVIVCTTAVARASEMRGLLSQFTANSVWPWVTGAFTLLFGLVINAVHQYWRGAAAAIVSLLGWLIALRGLFLLTLPNAFDSMANTMIGAQAWWITVCIAVALVGLYLTYVGWKPTATRQTSHAPSSTPNMRHAA